MMTERGAAEVAGARFVPDAGGTRWVYAGALTYANAAAVLAGAAELPLPTAGEVDLRSLTSVDSAAVAVLLALKRRAGAAGAPLTFVDVPASLTALADLYSVEEILAG